MTKDYLQRKEFEMEYKENTNRENMNPELGEE